MDNYHIADYNLFWLNIRSNLRQRLQKMESKGFTRCNWCENDPEYINYHDNEWGIPKFDDNVLFEALSLEIFQAGLSWMTILKKGII